MQYDGEIEQLPTTFSEAGDASDESTTTCDDDLSEGFEEKTAVIDAKDYWPWRRVDANGKDSWWPKRGHHSGHIFPNGSRSGPARGLTRDELAGLREEAQFAKQYNLQRQARGPHVKPGEKPGFWRGQAWCWGHMGGGRRFRNRGGRYRVYFKEKAMRGEIRPTPGKSHPGYAASAAWHKDRAAWHKRAYA